MNDYWHIPRASLASSAASVSAASSASSTNRSNHSGIHSTATTTKMHDAMLYKKTNSDDYHHSNKVNNKKTQQNFKTANEAANKNGIGKRGSRSSQGSSDSNNSTRSNASGSLLLTAANLERFAEIHKEQQKLNRNNKNYLNGELTMVHQQQQQQQQQQVAANRYLNVNLVHHQQQQQQQQQNGNKTVVDNNNSTIIQVQDPNLDFVKTKDLDTLSVASSMHFTMVNGEGGQTKKQKRGLCDRGRQVTVLIVSMSTIFLLLIMGMVYALEIRAREMPQS